MKNVFAILLVVCFCFEAKAQECLGNTVITTQAQLTTLDAAPWCVEGHLTVSGNNNIPTVVFKNLTSVSGCIYVTYRRPPTNWTLEFQSIEHIGCLSVGSNRRLTKIDLGEFVVDSGLTKVYSNANLNSIRLGSLVTAYHLRIYSNAVLSSMSARDLVSVPGDLEIYDNTSLPTCSIEDLTYYIEYGEANIYNNGQDACYPWEP